MPSPQGDVSISDYYQPQDVQMLFHNSTAKYPLMEGGRGGGKSTALLWEAIWQCLLIPGANCLLLRRTLTAVEKGGIEDLFWKNVPKRIYRHFSKHIVTFYNGSKLFFGHIKADRDLLQYQGAEFVFIGWEELTQFTYRHWDYLKGSNRCPIKTFIFNGKEFPVFARMAGGTNPNGIGSGWVKALWITKKPPSGEMIVNYNPDDYEAIHSTFADNKVYANDKDYIAKLYSISDPVLREAWIPGSWDILAGQFFHNWDEELHTIGGKDSRLKLSDIKYLDWQPRWISIDWGFQHASVILWWTIVQVPDQFPDENGQDRKKTIILCYRQLVCRKLNEELLSEQIAAANHTGEIFDKISNIYLSPDRFVATGSGADAVHSIADKMGDIFVKYDMPRPERANNRRVDGWRLCYTLLDTEGVAVLASCRDVVDSIPKLMRSEKEVEDAEKEGDDLFLDVCESFRYGLMSYASTAPIPRDVAMQERIKAIKDPTQKYMEYLRLTARPAIDDIVIPIPPRSSTYRRR